MDLTTLVNDYKTVVARRRSLEGEAAALKTGVENELKIKILQLMAEKGVQSIKLKGVGHIVRCSKSHYEIVDKEAFAMAVLRGIVAALKDGRPALDGLIAQARVSKEALEASGLDINASGVAMVEKPELSIRKA